MKKVWIVNHSAIPPELGGLNRHYYFSKYLSAKGYDIRIITASKIHNTAVNIIGKHEKSIFKEKQFGEVVYTYVKTSDYRGNGLSRVINLIQFPWRLMRHYKKLDRPDIIYASSPSPFAAFIAVSIAKKLKIPVIVEIRDLWPESIVAYRRASRRSPVIWAMYRLEKWIYKHADRLVFTMEGGTDYLREKHLESMVDAGRIFHINNGVDLEEYKRNRALPFDDPDLEDENTFKVIYTGSVRTVNHLGDMLDTAKLLTKTHPGIRFLVYGDGVERGRLEERCAAEGIANVRFKGRVERKYIAAILSHADVNLLHMNPLGAQDLMRFGCSPNKLFDYFASGKPTISNFRPGYDLILRYGCSVVAESSTPDALARAILAVYGMSKDEYTRLCENAGRAARDYDYQLLARNLHGIIQDLEAKQ